jgi:AraC-like DNA-binding protein
MDGDVTLVDYRRMWPGEALAPHVGRCLGYRLAGFEPGTHGGLPSEYLTMVIGLGEATHVDELPDGSAGTSFDALVGGLHTRPAVIRHDGSQHGIQLGLTPAGARALLGMPAAELRSSVVELGDIAPELATLSDQLTELDGWQRRFAVLDELLTRRLSRVAGRRGPPPVSLRYAWDRITSSGGRLRIGELAAEIGWSRRHLTARFRAEFGLTPKEAARVARFQRSRLALEHPSRLGLADVAARCGYADQAHLAREWAELAGCPPSVWRVREDLPFVQDEAPDLVTR